MFKAAKAIIRCENSFFLQLRDNVSSIPYPNFWAFFGGRLLKNEEPKDGLVREIKEELSFSPINPKEFFRWHNSETNTLIIFFLIELKKKESFKNVNEGQKGKWFEKKDLDVISIAPDIRAVKIFL